MMSLRPSTATVYACLLIMLALACAGCVRDYDFERRPAARGTLGEELHQIWRKDAARAAENAPEKTAMLDARRDDFVLAVDRMAPPDTLLEIDRFLRDFWRLVKEDILPELTRKVVSLLREAAGDDALVEALGANRRPDPSTYLSPRAGQNMMGHLLSYSRISEVGSRLAKRLLDNDGYQPRGGLAPQEARSLGDTLIALSEFLNDVEAANPADSFAFALSDVLLAEDVRFEAADTVDPTFAVRYDARGYPLVATRAGSLGFPFVDADGDGLADVDPQGHFVLQTGTNLQLRPFETDPERNQLLNRDSWGRGYANEGEYAFEYIDLNRTGLSFVARQIGFVTARGLLWDLSEFAPTVFGPVQPLQDTRGTYLGYEADDNPLVDAFHALFHVLDFPQLQDAMVALADFMDTHSAALASLVFALDEMVDVFDQHPDARMSDEQTLLYDLMPVLEEIAADPSLWADFVDALADPVTRRSGEAMADLLDHRDAITMAPEVGGAYDQCFQACKGSHALGTVARFECVRACPRDGMFADDMDFDAPESEANRSLFARLMHLLRDTQAQPFELEFIEPGWLGPAPPLVRFDGAAEAFLRSVAGNLDLEDYVPDDFWSSSIGQLIDLIPGVGSGELAALLSAVSPVIGTELDKEPTPDQITRLFNQAEFRGEVGSVQLAFAPPICKDGFVMANHHADMLFAAEATGLIDAIHPLAKAFSDHDREDLLARLFATLHTHYSSRDDLYEDADGVDSPMAASNLVSYEPGLREVFARGTLFDALAELSLAASEAQAAGSADLVEHLRQLVHSALRTDQRFSMRNGEQALILPDGRTIAALSPLHGLVEALDTLSERVDASPGARQNFNNGVSTIFDVFLRASWPEGEPASFDNQGTVALGALTVRRLADEARERREAGQLSPWLTDELVQDVADVVESRLLPAAIALQRELFATPEDRALTEDLITFLVSGPQGQSQAAMAAYIVMVYAQHVDLWVPLSRFLARALDPDRAWAVGPLAELPLASHALLLLQRTLELDAEETGVAMLRRSFTTDTDQTTPIFELLDVSSDYFRADPTSREAFRADDYRRVFTGFADWLDDDVRGMEQFYDIVERRQEAR